MIASALAEDETNFQAWAAIVKRNPVTLVKLPEELRNFHDNISIFPKRLGSDNVGTTVFGDSEAYPSLAL